MPQLVHDRRTRAVRLAVPEKAGPPPPSTVEIRDSAQHESAKAHLFLQRRRGLHPPRAGARRPLRRPARRAARRPARRGGAGRRPRRRHARRRGLRRLPVASPGHRRRARRPARGCRALWLNDAEPRVRMGLHTGVAREDGRNDYVGIEVHRASRIANAAHGGQVLVSSATAAVVDGRAARSGRVRTRTDSTSPSGSSSSSTSDLDAEFPMLRSGPPRRGLSVALADDSVIVREGIARLLTEAGIEVVSQAGTPDRAPAQHRGEPAGRGRRGHPHAAERQRRGPARREDDPQPSSPGVGVVLLSQALEPAYAAELDRG